SNFWTLYASLLFPQGSARISVPLPSAIVFSREPTIAAFSSSVRVGAPTKMVSYRFFNLSLLVAFQPAPAGKEQAGHPALSGSRDAGLPGPGLPSVVDIHRLVDSVLDHGEDRLRGPFDHQIRRFALLRKKTLQHVVREVGLAALPEDAES